MTQKERECIQHDALLIDSRFYSGVTREVLFENLYSSLIWC